MAWTCYLADRAAPTVPLFDFVDTDGSSNPEGVQSWVKGIDKGSFAPARDVFVPDVGDQPRVTRRRMPAVMMALDLRFDAPSHDALRLGVARLEWLLQRDGVLVLQPDGATETEYIYTLGGDVTQLFRGGILNLIQLVTDTRDPDGFTLPILREPGIRVAELAPAVNLIGNPTLLIDLNGDGIPDGWSFDATDFGSPQINAGAQAFRFTKTNTGTGFILARNTAAASIAPGDVVTFTLYFRAVSGTFTGDTVRADMTWRTSGGAAITTVTGVAVVNPVVGTIYRLVCTATAPATTDRVEVMISMAASSGTGEVMEIWNAQAEKASAPTRFRVGPQVVSGNPASTTDAPRVLALWNDGDLPAPFRLDLTLDASATVADLLLAERGSEGIAGLNSLTTLLNGPRYVALDATAGGWTIALTNDTTAVGGDARTTHATNPTVSNKRVRATRTTSLDALRGVFDVYYRGKVTATSVHEVELRWSPSLADPATYSNTDDVFTHTVSAAAFGYVEGYLGRISIPRSGSLAGIALELWTRRVSGSGNLDSDLLWFVPADVEAGDQSARLRVPAGSSESFDDSTLIGGASFSNPAGKTDGILQAEGYRLDAVNDGAGTSPAAGFAWPAARHRVTFRAYIEYAIGGNMVVDFAVRNITDANDAVIQSVTYATPPAVGFVEVVVEFDSVGGKSYQPQVRIASATAATFALFVNGIDHQVVYSIGASQMVRSDPGDAFTVQRLDSAGAYLADLAVAGPIPFVLDPGLSLVFIRGLDIALPGYTDLESDTARTVTVNAYHAPRQLV